MNKTATLAAVLVFAFVLAATAQEPQWGTPQYHVACHHHPNGEEVCSVVQEAGHLSHGAGGVYSSNIGFQKSFTIAAKPGRGISYFMTRLYNSNVYYNDGIGFQPVSTGNGSPNGPGPASWGWMTLTPYGAIASDESVSSCTYSPCPTCGLRSINYPVYSNYRFYDSSGVMHSFALSLSQTVTCHTGQTTGSSSTADGYLLYADIVTPSNTKVTAPNGWVYHNGSVEDTNGNIVNSSADTTGVNVVSTSTSTNCVNPVDGATYPNCTMYNVLEPGSTATQTWTEYYSNVSVATNANCSGVSDYSGTASLPIYLVMPEYTSGSNWYYKFGYDGAGRINSIRYPTGGTSSYTYGSLCTFKDGTVDSLTETDNDNNGNTAITTKYTRSSSQTTVTAPSGAKTVISYTSGGLPTEADYYDTDGTTLKKKIVFSNSTNFPSTAVMYLDGSSAKFSESDRNFDSYGNLTSDTEIDWARDSTGNTKRVTTISYETASAYINANILNLPTQVKVTDGTNTLSQLNVTYDNYSSPSELVASSGSVNHDTGYSTSNTLRANPTIISRYTSSSATLTSYFGYEDTGNVVKTQEVNGNIITASYGNCSDSYLSSVSVAGGTQSLAYECSRGRLTSVTDPNNAKGSVNYDVYGRVHSTSNPDGGSTTYSYPDPNNTQTTVAVDSSNNLNSYTVVDGLGNVIYNQIENPAGQWDTTQTVYQPGSSIVKVSNPYSTGHPASTGSLFTVTTSDGLGRPIKKVAPDGSTTTWSYQQGAVKVTDPRGVAKVVQSDGLGRNWEVCEVSTQTGYSACGTAIAANGFLTTYSYGSNTTGETSTVTQGVQARTFGSDWAGRLVTQTDPESGTTSYVYDSASDASCAGGLSTSTSTSKGDLILTTDAASGKVCLNYDTWHRLTRKGYSSGEVYSYTWDGSASSYQLGRISAATAPAASDTFVYDSVGRPTTITETPGSLAQQTITYTWNYAGEAKSEVAPSRTFGYTYDAKGRLTQLTDTVNNITLVGNRSFNAADDVTAEKFSPNASPVPLSATYSYNNMLQPWQLIFTAKGTSTETLEYHWGASVDTNGNVTSNDNDGTLRNLNFPNSTGWNLAYGYDDMNRISTAQSGDGAIGVTGEGVDRYGNRNSQTGTLAEAFSSSSSTNRISNSGFIYDPAGRLTSGTWGSITVSRGLTWNAGGELTQYSEGGTTKATYKYDAFGRRVEVIGSSTTYYLYGASDGGHPIDETSNAGSSWSRSIIADGALVGTITTAGAITYNALDALGTTAETVNVSSGVVTQFRYYPYGEVANGSSSEYMWTNQIRDSNGNDHFAFRDFTAPLARWLKPDPGNLGVVDPTNPQSWNRYAYVLNDPCSQVDPLGLSDGCGQDPINHLLGVPPEDQLPASYLNASDLRPDGKGYYGAPRDNPTGKHWGVDLSADDRTPLYPFLGGTVLETGFGKQRGEYATIDAGGGVTYTYMHLSELFVQKGDVLSSDTLVGLSGTTGNAQDLPRSDSHLHLEIKVNGHYTSPFDFMKKPCPKGVKNLPPSPNGNGGGGGPHPASQPSSGPGTGMMDWFCMSDADPTSSGPCGPMPTPFEYRELE